jgi:uncharacterized DUF497 family protein
LREFKFDPDKSGVNKAKHGIDFVEAQALWRDPRPLEVSARTDDEPRFLAIGLIGEKRWSAVCVRRGEKVRLISVRRARRTEALYYEGS